MLLKETYYYVAKKRHIIMLQLDSGKSLAVVF